jgi:hypothetical protein
MDSALKYALSTTGFTDFTELGQKHFWGLKCVNLQGTMELRVALFSRKYDGYSFFPAWRSANRSR